MSSTERPSVITVAPGDPDYPVPLLPLGADGADGASGEGAPTVHLRGDPRAALLPCVAIVGSRRASPYGLEVARFLASELAGHAIAVVSGLARGIDGAAHQGALDGEGVTIAVLGTGIDRCYPREHRRLSERIAATGLLITELPHGTPPLPHHFPRRNRIIAALADVVVVVEATLGSGSRHTAEAAFAQGKLVMAVPGPITSPTSKGTNRLLRDGAEPMTELADVLQALASSARWCGRTFAPRSSLPFAAPAPASPLLAEVPLDTGRHVEAIALASGLPIGAVLGELQGLVLQGLVRQLPGQHFQRVLRELA